METATLFVCKMPPTYPTHRTHPGRNMRLVHGLYLGQGLGHVLAGQRQVLVQQLGRGSKGGMGAGGDPGLQLLRGLDQLGRVASSQLLWRVVRRYNELQAASSCGE